jgi:glycerol-3-phosphate dehydrogenase (NAD(P)+)
MAASDPILVAGAGSWGTALARLLAANGRPVRLWGRRSEHLAALDRDRENSRYLPGARLPPEIAVSADLRLGLTGVHDVIAAVPVAGLRQLLVDIEAANGAGVRVMLACKGMERGTGMLGHQIVAQVLGDSTACAVLSGPTFAAEIAQGHPSAAVIAATTPEFAEDMLARLHSRFFRIYRTEDLLGIQIAGAVKNVMAIAAGVSDGLAFGANSRAALITRGLAEMTRLGLTLGGRAETFMGLAGLGDLVLTCSDDQSRNRRFGLLLAQGRTRAAALSVIGQAVEGVQTAEEVVRIAARSGVDMPISGQVARLLAGECTPREAVEALLARSPKHEDR